MYFLQNRWQREGKRLIYYGLRAKPNLFKNKIMLTRRQCEIIDKLPCELTQAELQRVKKLVGAQIVPANLLRKTPNNLDEATFCTTCAANDYIIPGLEFDADGRCPMCQTAQETSHLRSVVPIMNTFPHAKKSRFDVAVFYTGGKDSTYLLYYLSKVQGLRVLALTWEIPFMSPSAQKSIENAKKCLQNVEFICRKLNDADLKKIYAHLYSLAGNTCACPSLAYVLFYPELVANRVPYFVVGNESAQLIGLYYNHMAPKLAYTFDGNGFLKFLLNVGRVLTLRPPYRKGQFHAIATMKQLAYGDSPFKKIAGYENKLVSNAVESIHQIPAIVKPLRRAIRASSWRGTIPAFVQVDFDQISGGTYDWRKVKDTITAECGWVPPDNSDKGLHTSCKIEKCKEYSQYVRFRNMQSTMIPFSALEISLASRDGAISREDAIYEQKSALGFALEEIPECALMRQYLEH